mgnify:CR=1 FL=1
MRAPNEPSAQDLAAHFALLTDTELLHQYAGGGLTELAQSVAAAQALARGLSLPPVRPSLDETASEIEPYHGDLVMIARLLTPTEAFLMQSCLHSCGVPAEVADTHFVQTQSLLTGAVGGASVRVPLEFVSQALAVLAAYQRGDFRIGEDFDTGPPIESN